MARFVEVAVMLLAAVLEVGGDAMIRAGLRARGWLLVALGAVVLGAYGIVLNRLPIDSRSCLAPTLLSSRSRASRSAVLSFASTSRPPRGSASPSC